MFVGEAFRTGGPVRYTPWVAKPPNMDRAVLAGYMHADELVLWIAVTVQTKKRTDADSAATTKATVNVSAVGWFSVVGSDLEELVRVTYTPLGNYCQVETAPLMWLHDAP